MFVVASQSRTNKGTLGSQRFRPVMEIENDLGRKLCVYGSHFGMMGDAGNVCLLTLMNAN